MSPSMRGASPGFHSPSGCSAGNDSTLVGLSMPRQLLFSVRMPASSVSITATSASATSSSTFSAAAATARWITASDSGSRCQQSATTRTSVMGRLGCDIVLVPNEGAPCPRPYGPVAASSGFTGGRPLRGPFVGGDDPRHELVADHVFGLEMNLRNAFDAAQQARRLGESRGLAVRQVDLRGIAGDDHAAVFAKAGQKHLHLHRRGVLRLVQDDGRVGERATAHEGEWRDLDLAGLQRALDNARVHQVIERVVDRAKIRIDLLAEIAGQKAEPLAGFHRRTGQDDLVDFLALEQLRGMRDREPGLAGAGGADAEHQLVALQRADVGILRRRARTHRALAQIDAVEGGFGRLGVELEQRALRDHGTDRALDLALVEILSLHGLGVERLQHPARGIAAVARAADGDVAALGIDDDAEPPFDLRQMLAVGPTSADVARLSSKSMTTWVSGGTCISRSNLRLGAIEEESDALLGKGSGSSGDG